MKLQFVEAGEIVTTHGVKGEMKVLTWLDDPEMLCELVKNRLIDYVAMDIKNSKEKYAKTVGIENFDIERICNQHDCNKRFEYPLKESPCFKIGKIIVVYNHLYQLITGNERKYHAGNRDND